LECIGDKPASDMENFATVLLSLLVLRILDKLTEDSVLIRPLTKEEVLQIVDIFARKVEYSYTQDRFVK